MVSPRLLFYPPLSLGGFLPCVVKASPHRVEEELAEVPESGRSESIIDDPPSLVPLPV